MHSTSGFEPSGAQPVSTVYGGLDVDAALYHERRSQGAGQCSKRPAIDCFLGQLPDLPADARVLEVAAGTGIFTLPALRRGLRVTASDARPQMLHFLREQASQAELSDSCTLLCENALALSHPDACFDFVFCVALLPLIPSWETRRAVLAELARVTAPGGTLFFTYRPAASLLRILRRRSGDSRARISRTLGAAGMRIVRRRATGALDRALWRRVPERLRTLVAVGDRMAAQLPLLGSRSFVLAAKAPRPGTTL